MQKAIENQSIIFYGAGTEAKRKLAKWEAQGLVPVCFADRDESKHYTKFVSEEECHTNTERYDILPLDAAIEKYPDYAIYLTVAPQNMSSVTQCLLERKIPEERIRYAGQYYRGLGCKHLGKEFVSYGGILTCVVVPCRYFDISLSPDIDDLYSQYKSKTKSFVLDNMLGKPTLCKDCYKLQYGIWEIEPQITDVNISSDPDDFCNSKCVYCVNYPKSSKEKIMKREKYILDVAKYFTAKADGEPLGLYISAGEISVSSYCDEVMRIFSENENLHVGISTNAIVFKQSIADILATGRAGLIISLDSGTPETMIKVRGFDCFESSVRNCVKYAQYLPQKTMLSMKYIILEGINDNETDIRRFLDIAKSIGCVAELSANCHNLEKTNLSDHGLEMCYLFMRICRDYSLTFRYIDYYFNDKDRSVIEKYRQELRL